MNLLSAFFRKLTGAAVVLAVVTLMACSVTVEPGNETASRALIDRVPAGATAIGWVDFEALAEVMPQEDWAEYEQMLQDDEDMATFDRFVEATGIDPREDMMQLAFVALPTAAAPDDYLVLMSADFDRGKIEGLAADAETVSYEGVTFYSAEDVFRSISEAVGRPVTEDEGMAAQETPGWVAILDGQTIGMGTEVSLRTVVDVDGGRHEALSSDATMTALVSDVADEGQIWFVATRETWQERMDDLGQNPMVPSAAIDTIEDVTLSLRMGDGMTLRIAGTAGTPEAANELTTSLNGLLGMGRMMLQQGEPELFAILDRALSVRQEDRTVRIQADLTEQDIEVLQRLAEEQEQMR